MNETPGGTLTPVDTARRLILDGVPRIRGGKRVGLAAAAGRILTSGMRAEIDVPPFANSAMDGYALRAADARQSPVTLPVNLRIAAGRDGGSLPAGEAARIFTGAMMPAGADAVVIQENCRARAGEVTVLQPAVPGQHVRGAGDAMRRGEPLFAAGHRLLPQDIGVLAAAGHAEIPVRRKLRVALLTTGNELVAPGGALGPGQIYNGNLHSLSSLLRRLPVKLIDLGITGDNLKDTRTALIDAAGRADCVISTGGVSVGEEDHVRAAVEREGELRLWKLAIKPGKPLAWGTVRETSFFGLPGNPVSAFVTFCLIVRPALLAMMGCAAPALAMTPGGYPLPAGFTAPVSGERQEYLRVSVVADENGAESVRPDPNQSSGAASSLSRSDGLLVVPPRTAVRKGDRLRFIPYSEWLA